MKRGSARPKAERGPSERDRGRSAHGLLIAIAYVAVGLVMAWVAVVAARALEIAPEGQRLVAFVCIGTAVALAALRRDLKETGPVALVATLVAVTTAAVAALGYIGPIEDAPALGCMNTHGELDATISKDTPVYAAATAASPAKRFLLKGCDIHPVGYCIGAPHTDQLEGAVRDARWFKLEDGRGYVPSGWTVGTIPADRKRTECEQGVPPPGRVDFQGARVDPSTGAIRVSAISPRAAFIGFAMRRSASTWTRLGWDDTPEDRTAQTMYAPHGAEPGVEVAAVACVAFQRPSGLPAKRRLESGSVDHKGPKFRQPPPASAQEVACNSGTR